LVEPADVDTKAPIPRFIYPEEGDVLNSPIIETILTVEEGVQLGQVVVALTLETLQEPHRLGPVGTAEALGRLAQPQARDDAIDRAHGAAAVLPRAHEQGVGPAVHLALAGIEHALEEVLHHPGHVTEVLRGAEDQAVGGEHVPGAGFGAALHSADLIDAANEWIVFAQSEGQIRRAYDYWVLGKGAETRRRRWSVMHDVLGWGR